VVPEFGTSPCAFCQEKSGIPFVIAIPYKVVKNKLFIQAMGEIKYKEISCFI